MQARRQLDVVRGVVRGRFGAESEDVVQETMVSALRAEEQLACEGRRAAWLRQIARRKVADFGRSLERRGLGVGAERAPVDSPEAIVLRQERERLVREAVDALPRSQAAAARAFYIEGKSYEQIQQELGLSKEGLASRLWRARQSLKTSLAGVRGLAPLGATLQKSAPVVSLWNPLTQLLSLSVLPWAHARWGSRLPFWGAALLCVPLLVAMWLWPYGAYPAAAIGGAWLAEALVGLEGRNRINALCVGGLMLGVSTFTSGDSLEVLITGASWLLCHGVARAGVARRWESLGVVLGLTAGLLGVLLATPGSVQAMAMVGVMLLFCGGALLCIEALPVKRLPPALVGAVMMIVSAWVIHPMLVHAWYR